MPCVDRCQPLAEILAAALAAACGAKRPPALAAPAGEASQAPGGEREPLARPIDEGPDIRSIEGDEATGFDIPADAEAGPLADIRFDYDSSTLTDEARALLERHALWLQNRRGVNVSVEGHCDERGTVEYNLALGEQRARAVRDYLVSLGVASERLRTVSYGKERPLDPGTGEEAWARNRRAHLAVARQ
jgi:peptidoglycan-associated lipoprotein